MPLPGRRPGPRSPRDTRRARRLVAGDPAAHAPLSVVVLRLIWPALSASDTSAALVVPDLLALVAVRGGYDRATVEPFIDAVNTHPTSGAGLVIFVVGHIGGMVLLGATLWRNIPVWTSITLIISQPLHFVSYVALQNQLLDGA